MSVSQSSKLFETFDLFQRRGAQAREFQQEITPIDVKSYVPIAP
jgi:hypothetical protein